MDTQIYHFASKLAQARMQELQHEAHIARLQRRHLVSRSGAFFARLASVKFTAAPRSSAECCPA